MFLKKASNIFAILYLSLFSLSASAQGNKKVTFKTGNFFSGIEVGSKGVKMSILDFGKDLKKIDQYTVVTDTSINTDFISFTPATFSATLNALTSLFKVATDRYSIPSSQIFTTISSGVSIISEKEKKQDWLTLLADSFRIKIHDPKREVTVVDVTEEARLSHLGIIPDSRRFTTFLIDIGSGNTKGGFFPHGNTKDIRLFQLTWGTKSIANAAVSRVGSDTSFRNYARQIPRVLAGTPEEEIVYAVNVSGAYNMSDNIAFSGGIAWAVATLMYPELIDNAVIPVTYDEISEFSDRIANNYNLLSPESVANSVTDATIDKDFVKKQAKIVNKVFDQRALLAGTGLLLKIMRQFEGVYERKQFFLVKNGQTGWISAFVKHAVGQQ